MNKEKSRNTFWRDENGEIREGVKWNIEANEILVNGFRNDSVYYRGFYHVTYNGNGYLAGVYEVDDPDQRPTQEWLDMINEYASDNIKGVLYYSGDVGYWKNAVIFLL